MRFCYCEEQNWVLVISSYTVHKLLIYCQSGIYVDDIRFFSYKENIHGICNLMNLE